MIEIKVMENELTLRDKLAMSMEDLTKLLRDSYDLQENEPEKSAYWHLQQLRSKIKQLALHDVSDSADADYWSERCKHVENIWEKSPCDPDITDEQIEAHNDYHNFIKENGSKDYR